MNAVPVTFSLDLNETFRGPQGLQGPPGPAGALGEVVEFIPIVGGRDGESGQRYHYQTGHAIVTPLKVGKKVEFTSYTQFADQGTIAGPLVLKGLPFPTAYVPGFFGGTVSYSSNLSPTANELTALDLWTGGASSTWRFFGRRLGQNPRELTAADINLATQLICRGWYYTD